MNNRFELRFADENKYVRELKKLDRSTALLVHLAVTELLATEGPNLARTHWAKGLGKGLWEFRVGPSTTAVISKLGQSQQIEVAHQKLLFRVFFTTESPNTLLVLSAYDKAKDSSAIRQQKDIRNARRMQREHLTRTRP